MTEDKKEAPVFSVPLGHPLPLDEHACSVSLPTWCSVVGYEEGNPDVTSKMGCGYPRFVYHPYLLKLMDFSLDLDKKENDLFGKDERDCILLPGKGSANRARDFMIRALNMEGSIPLCSSDNALDSFSSVDDNDRYPIRVLPLPTKSVETYALIFPATTSAAIQAKSYWQHTGEVVSSRRAEVALMELGVNVCDIDRVTPNCIDPHSDFVQLEGKHKCDVTDKTYTCLHTSFTTNDETCNADTAKRQVEERIASIVAQPQSSVFLAPSGMAAIYQALRSTRRRRLQSSSPRGGTAIVYGFPYLDTLKMCGRPEFVPDGVEFFGCGDRQDLETLEKMLESRAASNPEGDAGICALITEFPSNPLLNCHDLESLRRLGDKYDFPLIVDDTISCFSNVDLLSTGIADAVCTSLTKLFNGRGDAMAGSLIVNEQTKIGKWMLHDLEQSYRKVGEENDLFATDITAINANSEDFLERSHVINQNSEQLADWFKDHPDVHHVYYPKYSQPALYDKFLKDPTPIHTPGYGGLMSILLGTHICQRTFYDKLPLSKGPSLGTNFTLICPYTLLAHYHELEFARTYNVSPNLIRIAVGLEDFEQIKDSFEYAFDLGRLHPKLKPLKPLEVGSNNSLDQQARGYCTFGYRPMLGGTNDIRCSGVGKLAVKSNHYNYTRAVCRGLSSGKGRNIMGSAIFHGLLQSSFFGGLR